jgi:hypothetical protein
MEPELRKVGTRAAERKIFIAQVSISDATGSAGSF